ncbi:hypothetical protein ACFWFI_08180 [Streptomyces sp. NPDC060209]|uniref:hypothetical protein n=1 Tax=Streptomyces sp. NPDC060209 TaxID=3347073 RepID=UPI00365CF1FD
MSRTHCRRGARILAVTYIVAMVAGGLLVGAQDSSHASSLSFRLSLPGLNVLYVFVLMPLTAVFGDFAGEAGDAGAGSPALACGLGAATNVLLVRAAVCLARMVAADLPACRKRRTPAR